MNTPRKRPNRRKKRGQVKTAAPAEFWRAAPEPPEPPDITPARDATAMLSSMGPPPLPGQQNAALPYLEAVALEAQKLATALAASADLLEFPGDD